MPGDRLLALRGKGGGPTGPPFFFSIGARGMAPGAMTGAVPVHSVGDPATCPIERLPVIIDNTIIPGRRVSPGHLLFRLDLSGHNYRAGKACHDGLRGIGKRGPGGQQSGSVIDYGHTNKENHHETNQDHRCSSTAGGSHLQ